MPLRKNNFELSPRLKFGVGRGYSQNQIFKFAAVACLALAAGLTFNAIRLISTGSEGSTDPTILGAIDSKLPGSQEFMEFTNYTVVKGDTLFNISQKFKISWSTLASLNNLKSPSSLKPGQVLKVPKQ